MRIPREGIGLLKFEKKVEKVAPLNIFIVRMLISLGLGLGLITFSLLIGVLGYHSLAKLSWIDAFLEASMILGGEGPITQAMSDGAKIFASIYALYSGLLIIAVMGIILTPVVHRMMHQFHIDEADEDAGTAPDDKEEKAKRTGRTKKR